MSLVQQLETQDNWQRQLAQAYKDPWLLARDLQLPESWVKQHAPARQLFALRVPKAFAALMQPGNPDDPLLRQVWPHADEFKKAEGYTADPLAEDDAQASPGLLHKYASRVLIILRGGCAVNCRYCFRRHFPYQEHKVGQQELAEICEYIRLHPQINEVILSGGDPLMASDDQLDKIITAIESLTQVTRLRIHSRLPVVIPDRLTEKLATRLAASRMQCLLVIHANHPQEISNHLRVKLAAWRKQGIWLLNQSVLLKGVNDSAECLAALSERLFESNVMPYYLHQLDKVAGAAHFAISDAKANLIMAELLKRLPGFLVPKLVQEIAGESSKTPINLQL